MRCRGTLTATVAACVLAAGCSGSDDSAATTVPLAPDLTAATTTAVAAPTTTGAPTLPTTTVAPTTAPPSSVVTVPLTLPPTSAPQTVAPGEPAAEIVAFVQEYFRLTNDARLDPTNDDKVAAASAVMTGAVLARFQEVVQRYRTENLRSVTFTPIPARLDVYPDTMSSDGTVAGIEVCWVNSNTLVQTGGNPDGTDRPVDSSIVALRQRYILDADAAGWKIRDIEELQRFEGAAECAA